MHHPWEHLLGAGIGAYAGAWVADWEVRAQAQIDDILRQREEKNKKIAELSDQ